MAGYRVGVTTPAAANAAPYATVHTNGNVARLIQWSVACTAATASPVSSGIAANNATPPVATTSATPQSTQQASIDAAATCRVDTAWSTAPTVPGTFHTKTTLPAAIGAGWIEKYFKDYIEPVTLSQATAQWYVFWNHGGSSGSALDLTVLIDQ